MCHNIYFMYTPAAPPVFFYVCKCSFFVGIKIEITKVLVFFMHDVS